MTILRKHTVKADGHYNQLTTLESVLLAAVQLSIAAVAVSFAVWAIAKIV